MIQLVSIFNIVIVIKGVGAVAPEDLDPDLSKKKSIYILPGTL